MTASLILLAIIVLLQAADVVTTAIGLRRGLVELNPLARVLFSRFGAVPAAIALKVLLMLPMAALAWFYPSWWPVPLVYAASLVWVVRHNLQALRGD